MNSHLEATEARISDGNLGANVLLGGPPPEEPAVGPAPAGQAEAPAVAGEFAHDLAGAPGVAGAPMLAVAEVGLEQPEPLDRDLGVVLDGVAALPSPVNYDEDGLGEVEVAGVLYRFDSGKQGTALCLSCRTEGNWSWQFLGELRWDGRDLRSKAIERRLLGQLSIELRKLAAGGEGD